MSLQTYKGATQPFTLELNLPDGAILTYDHTVLWMIKKKATDPDNEAVLTKRLSDGSLTIDDPGGESGPAIVAGVLSSTETETAFDQFANGSNEVNFETEVRVITPPPDNHVQPLLFVKLAIRDTLIDQTEHDE